MDVIIENIGSPGLLPALEANMAEFWKNYGRAPGRELYEDQDLTRVITGLPFALMNGVYRAHLTSKTLEPALAATLVALEAWQVPLLWWVGPTAQPADLGAYLEDRGFFRAGDTPGMAIDLMVLPEDRPLPPDLRIESVEDEQTLETWARVAAIGTGFPESIQQDFVELELDVGLDPGSRARRYLGYQAGVPVASSTMVLHAGVAGIYAVATLPSARRQGIGAAMTLRPLLEARANGYRIGTLQSSELGYPVYRGLGFRDVCRFALYLWPAGD